MNLYEVKISLTCKYYVVAHTPNEALKLVAVTYPDGAPMTWESVTILAGPGTIGKPKLIVARGEE